MLMSKFKFESEIDAKWLDQNGILGCYEVNDTQEWLLHCESISPIRHPSSIPNRIFLKH